MKRKFTALTINGYTSCCPCDLALDTDYIVTVIDGCEGYSYLGNEVCRVIMRDGTIYAVKNSFEYATAKCNTDALGEVNR